MTQIPLEARKHGPYNIRKLTLFNQNHGDVLAKLKTLRRNRAADTTYSNLWERFRFLKHKDRKTCLKNLKTWNKRFGKFVESVCQAGYKQEALTVQQIDQGAAFRLRSLSKKLFQTLSSRWSCSCEAPHEARFCIATCGSNTKLGVALASIQFDFLISHRQSMWCESTVAIEAIRYVDRAHHQED